MTRTTRRLGLGFALAAALVDAVIERPRPRRRYRRSGWSAPRNACQRHAHLQPRGQERPRADARRQQRADVELRRPATQRRAPSSTRGRCSARTQGETIVVNLTNNLTIKKARQRSVPSSIVFPGQDGGHRHGRLRRPAHDRGRRRRWHGHLHVHRRQARARYLYESGTDVVEAGRDGPLRRPHRPPDRPGHRAELRLRPRRDAVRPVA